MDAGNKEQVKKRAREEMSARQRQMADLRDVLALKSGKRLLYRLLVETGLMASLLDRDPIMLAQEVGRHDFGVFLLREIQEARPEAFAEMILEAVNEPNEPKNEEKENE